MSTGIQNCLSNALIISQKVELILKEKTGLFVALGLYSIAIEEYGKALLLKDLLKEDQEEYSVPKNWFRGGDAHRIKIERAFKELPNECKVFLAGIEIQTNTDIDDVTIPVTPRGNSVTITGTGSFDSGLEFFIDLSTRMDCFFVDWDEDNDRWKDRPQTLEKPLQKSIKKFQLEIWQMLQSS